MKTRYGLVSNSSSTSFCLYGISTDEGFRSDLNELFDKIQKIQSVFPDVYSDYIKNALKQFSEQETDEFIAYKIKVYEFLSDIQNKKLEDYVKLCDISEDDGDDNFLYEVFSELCGFMNLSVYTYYEVNNTYIGREYRTIGDDETGKQFKDSVRNILPKIFNGCKCKIHEESWRDG